MVKLKERVDLLCLHTAVQFKHLSGSRIGLQANLGKLTDNFPRNEIFKKFEHEPGSEDGTDGSGAFSSELPL